MFSRGCPKDHVLSRLACGDLSEKKKNALLSHVSGCPSCQSRYAQFKALLALTHERPALEMPDQRFWTFFPGRVTAALSGQVPVRSAYRLSWALAGAMGLLVLMGIALRVWHEPRTQSEQTQTALAETPGTGESTTGKWDSSQMRPMIIAFLSSDEATEISEKELASVSEEEGTERDPVQTAWELMADDASESEFQETWSHDAQTYEESLELTDENAQQVLEYLSLSST